MINNELRKYLENHYRTYFGRSVKLRVTHLVDKGYYYQFNLWDGNIVLVGETVMKLDLELQSLQINSSEIK